ncbi:MAG TPA: GntR family transcriptional regulator [Acetobacteraceae bacterium]|nr:GntR family transcriptional regulator [Acetobacteraceae bacterium]
MAAPKRMPKGIHRAADSADRAYGAIRQWIIEFKLRPEERINELHLAQRLALSRTPVREALNRLASEGFVVFVPNRGFYCRSLDISDLIGVYEARAILERGAFALACKRASDAGIEAFARFWAGAQRNFRRRDPDEMLSLDEAFHRQLAELSGNQEIVRQLAAIDAKIRFVRRITLEHGPTQARLVEDHGALVAALEARNGVRGERVLAQHIFLSVEEARALLKEVLFRLYVSVPATARGQAA